MGKPIMWMFAIQNFSGVIGSLLAYGISYMDGVATLYAWRWVYFLGGMFTILFSLAVYQVLPDYPRSERTATWLTKREQEYIKMRLGEDAPKPDDKEFDKDEILASLKNPRTYAFMLTQVFMNRGGYALSWQLPTITTQLGFAELPKNQLLNIPPAAAAVLVIIFAGWFMKKAWITRPACISCICAGALTSFIVLATMTNKDGHLCGLHDGVHVLQCLSSSFLGVEEQFPEGKYRHCVYVGFPELYRTDWRSRWTAAVYREVERRGRVI